MQSVLLLKQKYNLHAEAEKGCVTSYDTLRIYMSFSSTGKFSNFPFDFHACTSGRLILYLPHVLPFDADHYENPLLMGW
jgi:hypothetical protein